MNVHEGPMGISWRPYPDDPGLQQGMVLSNEPGYYEDGVFGIRLENLVHIVKVGVKVRNMKMDLLNNYVRLRDDFYTILYGVTKRLSRIKKS